MQLTRNEKEELVDRLTAKMDEYAVVGVLDMHSMPARQLQEIKKELVDDAEIRMTRKTLINRALEQSAKPDIETLAENDARQPALIFSDANPFTLYSIIQEKKTSAAASGGEIAPTDIVINDGMTDIDPGPMLGEIQEFGAGTAVEDGKIKVTNTAVAVEAGEEISPKAAKVFNALGIEPLEIGLDLKLVYEDGERFDRDVLDIDTDAYQADVEAAVGQAFNLAVNTGYATDETAQPLLRQAFNRARNLAVNAGIIDEDVIEDLLRKGQGAAAGLDAALDLDAVDIDDDAGAADEAAGEDDEEQDADGSDDAADADEEDADDDMDRTDEEDADDQTTDTDEEVND